MNKSVDFDKLDDAIMIVEDTQESLKLLTKILEDEGFRVRPASSCELALRSLQVKLPALMILDVKMPGMDGFEFCRKIRENEKTAGIPVIFCSALGSEADRIKGFESGGVDYVTKPFHAAEIIARVRTHLNLRRALNELSDRKADLESALKERTAEIEEQNRKLREEVAERRRTQEELDKALKRLMAHIDNSPLAVVEFDNKFKVTLWSKKAEEIFGWSAGEIIGQNIGDMKWVHAEDREIVRIQSAGLFSGEKASSLNVNRNYRKDGSVINCEWYNSGIYDSNGNLISVLSLVLDTTERKKMEEEREKALNEVCLAKEAAETATKIKSQFLANMSHEIRTPINGIKGFTELLSMSPLSPDQRVQLEYISRSCGGLLRVINDILDYSKMESGKFEVNAYDFEIAKALETSCAIFQNEARARNIRFNYKFGDGMPKKIYGDAVRIRQIIDNLLSNAVKFTENGAVSFLAETTASSDNSVSIRFTVEDSGIGIPKERMNELFQPFTQLDMSMRKKFQGTGLGLSIVKKLVEQMKGEISVESSEGKGSRFTIELPFKLCGSTEREGTNFKEWPEQLRHPGPSLKILLAEDDDASRELVKTIAVKLGHSVDLTGDGMEALEKITGGAYDLVLLDIQLPNLSGLEIAKIVREREKSSGKHLPLIAVTAYAMQNEMDMIAGAGIDECVIKPIEVVKLSAAIAKHSAAAVQAR